MERLDVCDSCENLWTQLCDGVVSASLYPEHASAEWSKKDIHFYSIEVKCAEMLFNANFQLVLKSRKGEIKSLQI